MKKLFLAMLAVCMLTLSGCESDVETSSGNDTNTNQSVSKKTYAVGETVTVKGSSGEYTVTFTGIKETNERNEFWEEKADRVVIISYEVKNVSYEDDLYVSDFNMKCYDSDGTSMDTYPVDIKYSDKISAGRNTKGEVAYALNNSNNHIELEYYDNMFNSKPDFMVTFEW